MATRFDFDEMVGRVLNLEGGLSMNADDPGNWVGTELRGTNFGISARSYPDVNIKELTVEGAKDIYYRDYWLRAGCDQLPQALAFVHFDASVNHGVGAAKKFLADSGGSVDAYVVERLLFYASLKTWKSFGLGWSARLASVAAHARSYPAPARLSADDWKFVLYRGNELQPFPIEGDVVLRFSADDRKVHVRLEDSDGV